MVPRTDPWGERLAGERFPRGFCHQEASQAHGEEEAPQAAEEDARPAPQARQVVHAPGSPRNQPWAVSCSSPGSLVTSGGGSRAVLAATDGIDRVIGVDVVPPRGDVGAMSFIRADIRTPVIAKVIAKEDVDTVVHMSVIATPGSAGGRGTMKELNVIGTMQLLAACQKAPSVQHLVVKSTSTVYGASSPRPGDVHRGHGAAPQRRGPGSARTPPRSRATCAASPAAVPTSGSPCCAWPTSSAPTWSAR